MTEKDIIKALLNCHNTDKYFCVPHCKTGASWGNRYLGILDLWVMKKSYANPLVIGYEIKRLRSDFLHDDKWQRYLPYCNEFYFVVTGKDIAIPSEISPEAGLKYVSSTGTRIYTKKKAPYRNIEIPESIYEYILTSRVVTKSEKMQINRREYWKEWLKQKELDWLLGSRVSQALRETINNKINEVERENGILIRENNRLNRIKEFLDSIGINYKNLSNWNTNETIQDRLDKIETGFSAEFRNDLKGCINNLNKLNNYLGEIKC